MYKNNIYYCFKYFLNFCVGTLNNRNSKNNFAVNIKICNSLCVRNENKQYLTKEKTYLIGSFLKCLLSSLKNKIPEASMTLKLIFLIFQTIFPFNLIDF